MASLVSTTAFVVNLPKLNVSLHETLEADGFPIEALGARAFFEAVRQLNLRDLTEYVPTTSTATQGITEDTRMRVTNRVYIINVEMSLQGLELPFVYL